MLQAYAQHEASINVLKAFFTARVTVKEINNNICSQQIYIYTIAYAC